MLDTTDWTHEETARRLGLNRVTVSNYARGKLAPSRTVLLFMAHLTHNVVHLPGFRDTSGVVQDTSTEGLSSWEQEALGLLRRISSAQRQAILEVLATMAVPINYGVGSVQTSGAGKGKARRNSGEEDQPAPKPTEPPTSAIPPK